MRIACLPDGVAAPADFDILFDLYHNSGSPNRGRVGDLVPERLRRLQLAPTAQAWDFLSFALAVVAADETASRSRSPDGWTRQIELIVAVGAPDLWNAHTDKLVTALRFLTGDIWALEFIGYGIVPAPPKQALAREEDLVCLLSGGMDSLVGAIDITNAGSRPIFVSQMAKGDSEDQKRFAKTISPASLHIQLNHYARPPIPSERSQRARSIVFLAFGVLAATCLAKHRHGDVIELLVPENGFISQNVPLTPLRTGSLSTRTTHPYFLRTIQSVLDAADLRVAIRNPYESMTKGEMLVACADQKTLKELAPDSTSCGRFSRTGFQHCGRCVPCQVRRGAYLAWGEQDTTYKGYRYDALGTSDAKHARFDDVRAVAMAIETVRRSGVEALTGGALNGQMLGNPLPYRDVVERGIAELAGLHAQYGVG
jgi:hypothetical protein